MGSTPTLRGTAGVWNGDCTGPVSQVTYRIPLEFITRVNGGNNDGAATLTNSIQLRLVKWYHSWFGTKERKFDSCIGDHIT